MNMSGIEVVGGNRPWCVGGTSSNGCKAAALAGMAGYTGSGWVVRAGVTAPTNGARNLGAVERASMRQCRAWRLNIGPADGAGNARLAD